MGQYYYPTILREKNKRFAEDFLCRILGFSIIGIRKLVVKLLFSGQMIAQPTVGEATSLPCGTTLQNWVRSGEFVQITNISPFNQPLKKRSVAGG